MSSIEGTAAPSDQSPAPLRTWPWVLSFVVVAVIFTLDALDISLEPPKALVPLAAWILAATEWFTANFRTLFRAVTWLLTGPLGIVRSVLDWLAWPSIIMLVSALGFAARGSRLALFGALAILYIVVTGYWEKTSVTLSLVAVAVPLSILIGLIGGILAFRSLTARRVISPVLDLMQTIPTFAYLIPILALFGIGPVVGMIASALYAIPPMVHNVALALDRADPEMVEAAKMSGSTDRQLLWWVMLPSAMRTILIGVNQTVMASLSMVVIASMVGGVDDIGIEVFQSMKQAKFGESLLAGLVIALIAILMDRISRAFAGKSLDSFAGSPPILFWFGVLLGVLLLQGLAYFVPVIASYPESWVIELAPALNAALQWLTVTIFPITSAIKTWVVFVVLLPLKIGFSDSVRPNFWGFEMSPRITLFFAFITAALTVINWRFAGPKVALATAVGATLYYSGTTGVPWPAMGAFFVALGYLAGGLRVAILAALGALFILVTGSWTNAMISVQLTMVGVIFSFLVGMAIGIRAALDDRISAIVSPICDTLQTMPIFVFLIPAVMVFLVGEFTALIAIVMYAIVPSIRYTEHGIRSVPVEIVEAARMMGASRRQLLWQVQLPVAAPEIALGLNQTIMMALAMVIVASLVGAQGLGSDVMVALSRADPGRGLVAGLCVALIAIVADRTLQAWAATRKKALGLA
jgi:glycine betaine/proline transport system permease protein